MSRAVLATAVLLAALAPAVAAAGEVACVYERGVVVVPASVAGMAGDYIFDTGSPDTQLHETKAQMAGFTETAVRGRIRIAGLTLPDRPISVVNLDARTGAFPTPIAGVIGADLLADYVVDVRFAPCRIAIRRPGHAGPFAATGALPMVRDAGVASVKAAATDGRGVRVGEVVVATGSDAPLRLYERVARTPDAGPADALPSSGESRAVLRAMSLGAELFENVSTGLLEDGAAGRLGVVGAPLLSRWRLRFDFPRRQVLLATP